MSLTRCGLITFLGFCFLMSCQRPDIEQLPASEPPQPVATFSSNSCDNYTRFLNPDEEPKPQEIELDRYFRIAFNKEIEGDFEEAIAYYQKAFQLASCGCDRQHALAGKRAAAEAQELVARYGWESKPTQYFWARLQELTQSLPCVQIQQ